jgi:N utilization substance protein B
LFATDAVPPADAEAHATKQLEAYWRSRAESGPDLEGTLSVAEPEARTYAEALVLGVTSRLADVDAALRKASAHWRLERMARVDRTILRIGTWELLSDEQAPRAVVIDEAVELGKLYGASESASFVNGVLDRVAEDLGRK